MSPGQFQSAQLHHRCARLRPGNIAARVFGLNRERRSIRCRRMSAVGGRTHIPQPGRKVRYAKVENRTTQKISRKLILGSTDDSRKARLLVPPSANLKWYLCGD